jgi:mycofactocin precursor
VWRAPHQGRPREAGMNPETEQEELIAEDLVEEVSIDGMCGVY